MSVQTLPAHTMASALEGCEGEGVTAAADDDEALSSDELHPELTSISPTRAQATTRRLMLGTILRVRSEGLPLRQRGILA